MDFLNERSMPKLFKISHIRNIDEYMTVDELTLDPRLVLAEYERLSVRYQMLELILAEKRRRLRDELVPGVGTGFEVIHYLAKHDEFGGWCALSEQVRVRCRARPGGRVLLHLGCDVYLEQGLVELSDRLERQMQLAGQLASSIDEQLDTVDEQLQTIRCNMLQVLRWQQRREREVRSKKARKQFNVNEYDAAA